MGAIHPYPPLPPLSSSLRPRPQNLRGWGGGEYFSTSLPDGSLLRKLFSSFSLFHFSFLVFSAPLTAAKETSLHCSRVCLYWRFIRRSQRILSPAIRGVFNRSYISDMLDIDDFIRAVAAISENGCRSR